MTQVVSAQAVVEALYSGLLGRPADAAGLREKLQELENGSLTVASLVSGMLACEEFTHRVARLQGSPDAALEAEDVVAALYAHVLGRPADEGGLRDKVERVRSGGLSASDLVREFVSSEEFVERARAVLAAAGTPVTTRFTNDVSQYGEIPLLLRHMVNDAAWSRVVVDVGARGRERSNSYDLLKHFSWRGLLIEANPRLLDDIRSEFDGLAFELVGCAVSDYSGSARLTLGANDDVSSLTEVTAAFWGDTRGAVDVEVRRLPDILTERGVPLTFDLLSLDIEGEDIRVLNDLIDSSGYRPTWVLIEVAEPDEAPDLLQLGVSRIASSLYEIVDRTQSNLLLRRRDALPGAERFVDAFYRGLLRRPADAEALRVKAEQMTRAGLSFADLSSELLGSEEFRSARRDTADPARADHSRT